MKVIIHAILSDYFKIVPVAEVENVLPDEFLIIEDTISPEGIIIFFVNYAVFAIVEEDLVQLGIIIFSIIVCQDWYQAP